MTQPRSPQIPTPDPQAVLFYARGVLGIQMTSWQWDSLADAIHRFGYAAVASTDPTEPQSELETGQNPLSKAAAPISAAARKVTHGGTDTPIHRELTDGPQGAARDRDM